MVATKQTIFLAFIAIAVLLMGAMLFSCETDDDEDEEGALDYEPLPEGGQSGGSGSSGKTTADDDDDDSGTDGNCEGMIEKLYSCAGSFVDGEGVDVPLSEALLMCDVEGADNAMECFIACYLTYGSDCETMLTCMLDNCNPVQ